MKFLSDILAKAGLTVDGVVTLNNTATGQTPDANDNSTKLATTAWVRTFVQPYSLPIASASVLGGIKVGSGLSIDSGTGVLSATGGSGGSVGFRTIQEFTATAGQDTFTISGGYTAGYVEVFLNGVYLSESQYTATNGTTVILDDPAAHNDLVTVFLYSLYYVGETAASRDSVTLTATSGQTVFTTPYIPGQVDVYYNGSKLVSTEFTATNGSTITLAQAAVVGDLIEVVTHLVTGGVNSNRVLTINGVSYDLSQDRSWTITAGITGSGTTNYLSKWTGSTSLGNSVVYDNGSAIGINTTSPFESAAFKLDVNGGLLIKNTSGTPAQLVLIDSNPATGGNNGFVQLTAGGNTGTAFGQWQTFYGTSIASGTLRLQPAGGVVLVGSSTAITGAGLLQVAGDINITGTFKVNGTDIALGTTLNGTGFVKASGTTITYDNSTYATQTYVSTQINNLINGAPGLLDTLDELAAALGDDANFASTITTSIGTKVPQARTITINGTAYDLSADRSWSIAAGVTSFNTRTGDITPASGDYTTAQVTESGNLYYTNTRARLSISLTTTGTSGAATYDNATGVLNIPQYQGGVTSFNTRTGAITLSSSDVTTALGYTPVTNARTITINGTTYDLSANRSWTIAPDTSVRNIYTFTATASQTTFTVDGGYTVGLVDVFINGVKLSTTDFTATNGTTVVLATGTGVNNIVEIVKYVSAFTTAVENTRTLTINGTTYDLSANRTWSITNASLGAQPQLNGTGLVRMSGTTVSYDNATYATESYVTTAVANLVNSAPSTLDTLNELSAALGNDANFATTVTNSIATKLALSGGTLTGALIGTSATFSSSIDTYAGFNMVGGTSYLTINRANTSSDGVIIFRDATVNKWILGARGENTNNFYLYSYGTSGHPLVINYSTGAVTFSNSVTAASNTATGGFIEIQGSINAVKTLYINRYGVASGSQHRLRAENGYFEIASANSETINLTGGNVGIDSSNTYGWKFRVQASTTIGSSYGAEILGGTNSSDVAFSIRTALDVPIFRVRGDGNVGVGTTNPYALMHLMAPSGVGSSTQLIFDRAGGYGAYYVNYAYESTYYTNGSTLEFRAGNALTQIRLTSNNPYTAGNVQLMPSGGNVLVGTATDAGQKLYVSGTGRFDGQVLISADSGNEQFIIRRGSNFNQQLILGYHSSGYGRIQAVEQSVAYRPLALNGDGGNVLIGTYTDGGYKLAVGSGTQYLGSGFQISNNYSGSDRQCATGVADFAGTTVNIDLASVFPKTTFTNRGLSVTMQLVALPTYTIVSSAFVVLGRTGNSNQWASSIVTNLNINGAVINSISASGTVITITYNTYIFGTAYINLATIG